MEIRRIGILGGGAWGCGLACLAARAGREVILWARRSETVDAINRDHRNPDYLGDLEIEAAIQATTDLDAACEADAILIVVPAQAMRETAQALTSLAPATPVLCCAKGLEVPGGLLMSEVLAEYLPTQPIGCLSGPTFAREVVAGMPAAATLAIRDRALGDDLAGALGSAMFRPYRSDDVIGVEVGGAVKNVLAIACGIVSGHGFGENARAALLTRGLAETVRFAAALGGRAETLLGLGGVGDLAMTCSSRQSRNFRFGEALGKGGAEAGREAAIGGVVEGRLSAAAVIARASRHGVDMPISAAVDAILNGGVKSEDAIRGLMMRPLRPEGPGDG